MASRALTRCTQSGGPTVRLTRVPTDPTRRPIAVVVAAAGAALVGVALVVLGVASLVSGHGEFSGGVAFLLIGYGVGMMVAAGGLWRLSLFGRGPVLALSLLNAAAGLSVAGSAPWVWVFVVVSAVTVVAAALPATSAALHLRRGAADITPADGPPRKDEPGT